MRSHIRTVAVVVLALALLGLFLRNVDFSGVFREIARAQPGWLLLSLATIAVAGPRRTYRIEAYGEIARKQTDNEGRAVFPPVRSTINGVWDTKFVPQNSRKPAPKGAWMFSRED